MSSSSGGSGITFTGLLAIVFIALKLAGYIEWSWLWVLSPIWISWSVALAVLALILAMAGRDRR